MFGWNTSFLNIGSNPFIGQAFMHHHCHCNNPFMTMMQFNMFSNMMNSLFMPTRQFVMPQPVMPFVNNTLPAFNTNPWSAFGWTPSYNFANFDYSQNIKQTVKPSEVKPVKTATTDNSTPVNISDKKLVEYGFDTPDKRKGFRQLKPQMQRAVIELTNYAKSEGIKITYNSKRSIFRTYQEQVAIYKSARPGYAAKPGSSRHESGEAVDIKIPGANSNNPNDPQYKKLAQKWESMGYTWGGRWTCCEPWHFDLRKPKSKAKKA